MEELELRPTVKMLKNASGIYSAFFVDQLHGWHVNGKGTTEEYCMASACGEAMERLQAYFIYDRLDDTAPPCENRFCMYPDERLVNIQTTRDAFPVIYEELRNAYALEQQCAPSEVARDALDAFLKDYFLEKTVTAPYYGLAEKDVVYLPEQMISALCGSNGLAAGNTPQEALNQGIAEILERHIKDIVFQKGCTPPEIPRAFLQQNMPELWATVQEIEALGPYQIILKDVSLGLGMPVIGALFVDRAHQRYHAKFGASFSMQVAAERCLTELFQGFDLRNPASHKALMTPWNVQRSADWATSANRRVQLRSDTGSIPISFMEGEASWAFVDWETADGYGKSSFDNPTALQFMLEKLSCFEPRIYIRDYSFLGFPTYRIFVPGVSVTHLPLGPKRMQYKIEKTSVDLLKQYPAVKLHPQALEQCCHFLLAEDNLLRDAFNDVPMEAVQAVFAYCYGQLEQAIALLRSMPDTQQTKKYHCAAMELELQREGLSPLQRDRLLALFHQEKSVQFARRAFRKEEGRSDHAYLIDRVMDPQGKKVFLPGARTSSPARARMHERMRRKMRENMPDQAAVAECLPSLYSRRKEDGCHD